MRMRIVIVLALLISVLGWIVPAQAVVVRRTQRQTVYVKHRSKKKQVAIIGGSAAGGAAIGALAGGGKGAAIGALVGGAGGAIYNAKTKNKKVTQ